MGLVEQLVSKREKVSRFQIGISKDPRVSNDDRGDLGCRIFEGVRDAYKGLSPPTVSQYSRM